MKLMARLSPAFAILLFACTTRTITSAPGPAASEAQDPTQAGEAEGSGNGSENEPDAHEPQGIGTFDEKGLGIVSGNPQDPKTCKDVCAKNGGDCVRALDPGQGGAAVAGVATYLFVKPGQPAAFLPYDLQTCASAVPATQEATNDTGTLYQYECSCDGIAVPSRATVVAADGVHTCKDVCSSWEKTCTNARTWEDGSEGGALAFYGSGADIQTKAFNCGTKPAAKLEAAALSSYWCACE